MNCIPNWYTKVLEVADHDIAIRLLKLKMAVKNFIYIYLSILYSFKRYSCHADSPRPPGYYHAFKKRISGYDIEVKNLKNIKERGSAPKASIEEA